MARRARAGDNLIPFNAPPRPGGDGMSLDRGTGDRGTEWCSPYMDRVNANFVPEMAAAFNNGLYPLLIDQINHRHERYDGNREAAIIMSVLRFYTDYGYPVMTQSFCEEMSTCADMFLLFLERIAEDGLPGDGENNNPQGGRAGPGRNGGGGGGPLRRLAQ